MSQEYQTPDLAENGEILSIKCHEGTEGEYGCTFSLTSALVAGGSWSRPGKELPCPWNGKMGQPQAGLDGCGKCRPHQGSNPKTVQPVANGYPGPSGFAERKTKFVPNKHPNKALCYVPVCVSCNRVLKHAELLRDFRLRSHCSGNLGSLERYVT
jgi:hypothetical protein